MLFESPFVISRSRIWSLEVGRCCVSQPSNTPSGHPPRISVMVLGMEPSEQEVVDSAMRRSLMPSGVGPNGASLPAWIPSLRLLLFAE